MHNCPYYNVRDNGNPMLICWRGLKFRVKTFTCVDSMDKHEQLYCDNKYTSCRKYRQLEEDWGKV